MTTPTQDPHVLGTSASNAAADKLCQGRFQSSRHLPDQPNDWSDFGTKVHAALADGSNVTLISKLTPEQRDIFEAHREIEKKVITQIWNGEPDGSNRVWREQRYWAKVPLEDQPPFTTLYPHSGQADFVMRRLNKALIMDYKSLPGEVPESPQNEQLRDLAVMVWRTLVGVDEVIVCINQPLVTWTPELCRYTRPELEQAEREMWDRVRKSNAPNAPRTAGDLQCKFCKAKGVCQEYATWAASLLPEKESPFKVFMSDWTPEQRSIVAEHLPRLKKLLDDSEEYLKGLITTDENAVPGFCLKAGQTRETLNDPQELFNRFSATGGTLEQFMQCVAITKKKFEEQVRATTNTKGKALKSKLDELFAGIVDVKQNAPSLARRKE